MADIKSISETLQRIPLESKAIDKARHTLHDYVNSQYQTEQITYKPNQVEQSFSQIDFSMFLTGTVLKVNYKDDSSNDRCSLLVVEREKNLSFVFLVKQGGQIDLSSGLDKNRRYKLSPKGVFKSLNVSDVADVFFRNKNLADGNKHFETLSVDVMDGGLAPKKGKPVPKFGVPTLEPVKQESPNK